MRALRGGIRRQVRFVNADSDRGASAGGHKNTRRDRFGIKPHELPKIYKGYVSVTDLLPQSVDSAANPADRDGKPQAETKVRPGKFPIRMKIGPPPQRVGTLESDFRMQSGRAAEEGNDGSSGSHAAGSYRPAAAGRQQLEGSG